jgi:hypothetical protein
MPAVIGLMVLAIGDVLYRHLARPLRDRDRRQPGGGDVIAGASRPRQGRCARRWIGTVSSAAGDHAPVL